MTVSLTFWSSLRVQMEIITTMAISAPELVLLLPLKVTYTARSTHMLMPEFQVDTASIDFNYPAQQPTIAYLDDTFK